MQHAFNITAARFARAERALNIASLIVMAVAVTATLWAILDTWSGLPIHARPADRVVMMEVGR